METGLLGLGLRVYGSVCVQWRVWARVCRGMSFFLGEDWFSSPCQRMWWCPRGNTDGTDRH